MKSNGTLNFGLANKRNFAQLGRIVLFLLFCAGLTASLSSFPLKKKYRIEESSKLYLKGTSNVNSFTCQCEDEFNEQVMEAESSGAYARFHNTQVQLKVRNFDCHNRKIDADMQKALQADKYPFIGVALVDSWQSNNCQDKSCYNWFDVRANVNLTIARVTTKEYISGQARMVGSNRFEFRGEKPIQMSAYGIAPPEAMFGMIKVNDWITFHFDLIVTIDEGS